MQPGSVYRMVYRLTLMSLLFVQCNCWMTDVKLTCLYNNPPLPPHTRDLMQLWRRKKTILGRISFLGQSTVRERCRCNIKSNIRYEAGNQTRTTYALSARLCDWQPAPCYQQAWVAATSWLLLSPSLHMTSRWTSIMSEAESSLFEETGEKKKKTTGQPLTLWLSSNVRWWSTSRSAWNMLSGTALEDLTFPDPSSSHRDPAMLGKITSTPNLPSLRRNGSASHWHCVVLTSNQPNLLLFV